MLEELDLAQGALGQDLFAEDIGDLLDGNSLVRLGVHGGAVEETGLAWIMKDRMPYADAPKAEAAKQEQKRERADIPDNAVSSLAELLGDGVALVDNEVLVKDLEDLATHEISHGECCVRNGS